MMLQPYTLLRPQGLRAEINQAYRADEALVVKKLIQIAQLSTMQRAAVERTALKLVTHVRQARQDAVGIDSFLNTYALSTQEGIALMCLAEALLRIPDQVTIDKLIRDKLSHANWQAYLGESSSLFVNTTTWALIFTGKILQQDEEKHWWSTLKGFFSRSSEPMIRAAVAQAMKILSKQFVMGPTMPEAMTRAKKMEAEGYLFSYDMLGEAALTQVDADRYFDAYEQAIICLGQSLTQEKKPEYKSNISLKLSALHPRYQEAFAVEVRRELGQKLLKLAQLAKSYHLSLTVDAEESERLDLSLDIFADVFLDPSLADWTGLGLALQSYQKRTYAVIDWLVELAKKGGRRIMVRLIKGAYWDSEIKRSQMQGQTGFPVFTRKAFTDVSFQACAKKILEHRNLLYPAFATHNAYSVALILELVGDYRDFEFQCLHGMGKELYAEIVPAQKMGIPCRVYAPVGSYQDLLPYLVRRLLENGANSSFVNRVVDVNLPLHQLLEDPVQLAQSLLPHINQNIPLPKDIFAPRRNSQGIDWSDREVLANFQEQLAFFASTEWEAKSILAQPQQRAETAGMAIYSPHAKQRQVGLVYEAHLEDINLAYDYAEDAFLAWSNAEVEHRALCLERFADLLEKHLAEILALACLEAGKTLVDGLAELREAVDFCRYYAREARRLQQSPMVLQGYTGERNELSLHARGIMVAISPWNFPLAIFCGQVVAAIVVGNCVIAKPAEQTPLMAALAVRLMLQAGVPAGVIQLLPGRGETIGHALIQHTKCAGVLFTGSTQVARLIQRQLAQHEGAILPLIAETGGLNAMLVDSSALLEQVVNDVLTSAFGSAGQRCSALRVCFIQQDVYPRFKQLLQGAMAELRIGDPSYLSTDIGPVIDAAALEQLQDHAAAMKAQYPVICELALPPELAGYFFPPLALEIPEIGVLSQEVFGPILHVIPYSAAELESILAQINQTQYGLTLGIQSRINETIDFIHQTLHVGNCYVNRNMIGAVVGLQPFGGEGLSGTGPKAGGPYYLPRLCHERTLTIDTTAAGGNASLMAQADA